MPRPELLNQRTPSSCDDCIAEIATVAPLSRHRLKAIANGAPASNYEREQINRAQRVTGCQLVDCPHYGADACCGGAV